jgi:hypothetical protein
MALATSIFAQSTSSRPNPSGGYDYSMAFRHAKIQRADSIILMASLLAGIH